MAPELPGYMKVRAYLYNVAQHADRENLRIPSENELCRIFGVSRITVRGAIRGLVETRVLVSRRGVGTFVNPEFTGGGQLRLPVIGLMQNAGRDVHLSFSPTIRSGVLESGMCTENVVLPDSDDPARLLEMIAGSVDGIIWSSPAPQMRPCLNALRENGIPLLCIVEQEPCGLELSHFDLISVSRAGRGRVLADYLFRRGLTRLLYVHNYPEGKSGADSTENPQTTSGAVAARLAELAGKAAECRMCSILKLPERAELLAGFDAVYSGRELAPTLGRWFAEQKIRIPEDLSYLAYNPAAARFFGGKPVAYLADADARHDFVLDWLDQRIFHHDSGGLFQK